MRAALEKNHSLLFVVLLRVLHDLQAGRYHASPYIRGTECGYFHVRLLIHRVTRFHNHSIRNELEHDGGDRSDEQLGTPTA